MKTTIGAMVLARAGEYEIPLCLLFNRGAKRRLVRLFFSAISRLGDGVLWYSLILALPLLYGSSALTAVTHMMLVGLASLLLYKWIKHRTVRDRPCTASARIVRGVAPLDQYSFPSGHTLHAVAFSVVLLSHYPAFAWIVVPFTLLVALSRLVLGLHYPSDVLAGALIGGALALGSTYL
jgi:undecaprenyl-diphosphatase